MPASRPCPCSSGNPYAECCGPFHAGTATPPTAERLMRSRYAAFVIGDIAYLLASWHSSTRPATLELERDTHWIALEILSRTGGGMLHATATVEFVATWRGGSHRENSRFSREGGRWVYVEPV